MKITSVLQPFFDLGELIKRSTHFYEIPYKETTVLKMQVYCKIFVNLGLIITTVFLCVFGSFRIKIPLNLMAFKTFRFFKYILSRICFIKIEMFL